MRRFLARMRGRRASAVWPGRGRKLRLGGGLGRGRSVGLGLFEGLLALGLLGLLVLGAVTFFETRALEKRGRLAAVQLSVLAEAAASYAHSRFPALLTQALAGPSEIALASLKAAGSLTADFSEVDALGRGYRVLMLAAGPGRLRPAGGRDGGFRRHRAPGGGAAGGGGASHRPRGSLAALGSHGGGRSRGLPVRPFRVRRRKGLWRRSGASITAPSTAMRSTGSRSRGSRRPTGWRPTSTWRATPSRARARSRRRAWTWRRISRQAAISR